MKSTGKVEKTLTTLIIMASLLGTAVAQTSVPQAQTTSPSGPMIYPAQGQSPEQMEKDKADSYAWAKQQTGYDPIAAGLQAQQYPSTQQVTPQQPVPYAQPAPSQPSGGVLRGGARGAAGGAAIGAIAGDAGKGAAIGAASGGAIGGVRQRRAANAQADAMAQQQGAQQQAAMDQQAAQQQAMGQQKAANQQQMDAYKRAFSAAMEAKGYTVKW
jgi:hypothetical protein